MSLNGLDDPKVQEAYQASVAEPGGWFLLKYASRDEIDLLGRGSGGIVDIRTKISEYEETSPLYGFLRYRRRNVLIKYLPDDCSRLIQARVAVHFNAVCERFSPYDTTFEITMAKELKDTKLSAACSLHAASGSNSSSTSSIRRRRLVEIAEEEEEEQQQRATKRQSRSQEDDEEDHPSSPKSEIAPVTLNSDLASSPEARKFSASSTSEVPNFVGVDEASGSPDLSAEAAPRLSSQSGRPDYMSYPYIYGKPKVKLGPRPSVDSNGRPRTAGSFRPVSQMPAGIKMFGKGSKKGKKDDDAASVEEESIEIQPITPTPDDMLMAIEPARPATSSGVSIAATIVPTLPVKNVISPEKARLMKAMKLREKKKKKKGLTVEATGVESPDLLSPATSEDGPATDAAEDRSQDDDLEGTPSISNEDSAIGLEASSSPTTTDQASELTQTDSHPTSPVIASSEADHSTKASSLSESTDETVQDKGDDLRDSDDVFAITQPADEHPSGAIGSNPETPASTSITTPTEPAEPAVQSTEEEPSTKSVATVATPIVEPDSIPAPPAAALDESPSDSGPKTEKIPDATGTEVEEANGLVNEILTPTLRISTATIPDVDSALARATESPTKETQEGSQGIVTEQAEEKPVDKDDSESKPKRKTFVEPIRTDLVEVRPDSRVSNLSDDDDLMDELQSATFQEAKPMLVSKSPVTPVFPSPTKSEISLHTVRTVSNPVRGTLLVPGDVSQSSARSVSTGAAYLHKVAQQPVGPNMAKKSNMGSSISQRIKALEKLSAGSEGGSRTPSAERPSSAFFSVRKGREPSRSPSLADRANSFTRPAARTPPSRAGSQDESPDTARRPRRDRSASVASRLSMFEPVSSDGYSPSSTPRGRPETISVTAKIVRDSPQNAAKPFDPPKDPSEYNHLELKQSPLLVDHQKPVWTPVALEHTKEKEKEKEKEKDTLHERRMSKESNSQDAKSRRSSLSVVKDFIKERRKSVTSNTSDVLSPGHQSTSRSPTRPPSTHQNNSFTHRLSISSRRSSFSKDRDNVLSPTLTEGSASSDETKSNSDKKKSRAGRFMRRLSSLSGSSRGKIAVPPGVSPTVTEEDPEPIRPATTAGTASIVAQMGDVNVQFPDNLLWKRRNMCLDAQGFLVLSAIPGQSGRAAQGTKRYHMSEFRQPYPPDVEVQELPNSVVLDFMEGSGIQVACEDRSGQLKVLSTLQDAHRKHSARLGH